MRHHQQKIPLLPPSAVSPEGGEQGFVRILRSGKPLPEERESMFWLNIKGIPAMDSAPDKNMVQFAINSRIKLIFRPAALKNAIPENFAEKLQWSTEGREIKVKNASPLYMNFQKLQLMVNQSLKHGLLPLFNNKNTGSKRIFTREKENHMERDQ
jgi:P pilus assembly chaperone PapD